MSTIVREYFGANLAVINIGDVFTTGPEEAAFAVRELIRPVSVIPSHVNEAATQNGTAVAGSRTARFLDLLRPSFGGSGVSVLLPLSGVTMEFNSHGQCEVGCQGR
jgi:L-ascorbate metabolism protein UlaG (beta-lactamase superfamily)